MTKTEQKNTIKIHFASFWPELDPETFVFTNILRRKFRVILDANNPDFLFYSCFDKEYRDYDCVRICFLGENLTPDFNWCDYAVGFDHLNLGDRYLRYPLYHFWISNQNILGLSQHEAEAVFSRSGFCNFLYSNVDADPFREQLFDALCTHKPVDSGGKCRNTLGHRVEDGHAWQKGYKFSIACENSRKLGYTTEKLFCALAADTIPIYWGNPDVAKDFNPARFLQAQDFPSLDALVEAVRALEKDKERFCAMLREPWFCEGQSSTSPENDPELAAFLEYIVAQGPQAARRIPQHGYTRNMHNETRAHEKFVKRYLRYASLWHRVKRKLLFLKRLVKP